MGKSRTARIQLQFDPASGALPDGKKLRDGLSGVTGLLDTLWVLNDESLSIERLLRTRDRKPSFAGHITYPLQDYIRLPGSDGAEADLEDLDVSDGYLWLTGSHAAEREMPENKLSPRKVARTLEKVARSANRCLIARIPMVELDGAWTLRPRAGRGAGKRIAARLEGNAKGNALTRALRNDEHLGDSLARPGKENGFDVEGLAVAGARLLLGLRGPVLNEWAVILEIEPRVVRNRPSLLRLVRFGRGRKLYRKHFLKLDGLGVRGLCRQGPDLLVLAGPTAALDGPVRLYRWIGGARSDVERRMDIADLVPVMELPTGRGNDIPEGLVVVPSNDGRDRLLVVYERASKRRFRGEHGVDADLFLIPK